MSRCASGGPFRGHLRSSGDELEFELSYAQPEGEVAQTHLHFGQHGVNGGISIFLCSNLGNVDALGRYRRAPRGLLHPLLGRGAGSLSPAHLEQLPVRGVQLVDPPGRS
jgi:hypothetical protein